jgi:hypothetical protein
VAAVGVGAGVEAKVEVGAAKTEAAPRERRARKLDVNFILMIVVDRDCDFGW